MENTLTCLIFELPLVINEFDGSYSCRIFFSIGILLFWIDYFSYSMSFNLIHNFSLEDFFFFIDWAEYFTILYAL